MEGLIKKQKLGKFSLDLGVKILASRNKKAKNVALPQPVEKFTLDPVAQGKGARLFSSGHCLRARFEK